MARIPDEEITRIKRETDLLALVRSRGIELAKHGSKDFVGRCPFHEDNDSPNFIVSPAKGLYHCMACGAAGNPIQFVEKFDGVSFRHAFELLNGGKTAFENAPSRPIKQATVPKLPCPLDVEADDGTLLDQVADYYHERLTQSKPALDYLASRGFDDEGLVRRFRIGFADRTLGLRLPEKNRKEGEALRARLQELGVFRKDSGHEHFNGSIVFPIVNGNGHVREIYGRKITKNLRKGTPDHLYLPGPHHGIFNPDALKSPEIILCESILDALTFVRFGMENATCIYGTQGFTNELFEAIRAANLDAVRLAYDADESGEKAAKRDAEKLQAIGLAVYRIKLPMGEDVNSYALSAGVEALKRAVRTAEWLGAGAAPSPAPAAASSFLAAELAAEGAPLVGAKKEAVATPRQEAPDLVTYGEHHELTLGDRRYRVGGLAKNGGLDSLKLTLRVWHGERFHIDQVDLCRDVDRRRFCERAGHECRLDAELIKRDLGKLLLACERAQDARLRADMAPGEPAAAVIAPEERKEAEALLNAPDLIDRLDAAFESAGIVGEKTNRLAAYLTATSRLLPKPLAVIIQSTSAAGKTTLMEAVLSFFPPEEQVKYSAMTGQSLYYLGEKNLKHKILAIVEEEGAEKASYALKLLQSEGELTIASTGKDANTGRMKTEEYHVEGPVSIVLTTTSIDIDEELMNRCLILTVDESRGQTEAIHRLQRQARTLEGLRLKKTRRKTLTLLQNAQRLLKPVEVVNPYADELTFTAERTRTRRDHEKYLTLIESVTLLHQHQRTLEDDALAGPHIKTTLEDIAIANAIATQVLGRSLDELPPQTRRLLEALKAMVAEACDARKIDQDKARFTRRDVREASGSSETQVRLHLQRLEDFEYIARRHGRNGIGCVYELLVDCREAEGSTHVGLIDTGKLRGKKRV
jgi:DNA primase